MVIQTESGNEDSNLFFFIICPLPWLFSPAEGIEHVEEGDGDVDEDDQGEQGV